MLMLRVQQRQLRHCSCALVLGATYFSTLCLVLCPVPGYGGRKKPQVRGGGKGGKGLQGSLCSGTVLSPCEG